ncbi:MAG TPA: hypothetical protein IGS52_04595 [Oscillatoriaceae cyanobacterium M33_DOE_052]|nr:hypothetical protein [Oscillatoriaceae cyanobacterium M33_DOE_052]
MRLRSLTVSLGMLLLLSACGGESSEEQATSSPSPTDTPAAAPAPGSPTPTPTPNGAGAKPPAAAPFTTKAPAKDPTAVSNLLEPSNEDDVLAQIKPGTSNPFGILPLPPQQKPGEVKTSQLPEVTVATVPALPPLPDGIGPVGSAQPGQKGSKLPAVTARPVPALPKLPATIGPDLAKIESNVQLAAPPIPKLENRQISPFSGLPNITPYVDRRNNPLAIPARATRPQTIPPPPPQEPQKVAQVPQLPPDFGPPIGGGSIPTAAIPKQDSRQVPSLPELPTPIGPKVPERQQPGSPPRGTTPPGTTPPKPTPPPPPPPPSTDIAKAVEVTGVVQVNGEILIIVKAPNEPTTRYVKVGQRIGNGKVLVKRVEQLKGSEPIVVLEENGVEVNKEVGEMSGL